MGPGSFFGVISPPFAATAGSLHLDLALAAFIPHPTLHLPHHTPIYPDLRRGPNPACSVSYQLDSGCQGQAEQILLTYRKSGPNSPSQLVCEIPEAQDRKGLRGV